MPEDQEGILGLDHIGIAVKDLNEGIARFQTLLGAPPASRELVVEQNVDTAFFPVGEPNIELLEPTSQESPIAKFLDQKGEGIHHICLKVGNLESTLQRLKALGVRLIDETPKKGAHGKRVAFIHPKSLGGVLLELSESRVNPT